jgi:hypothetical protein
MQQRIGFAALLHRIVAEVLYGVLLCPLYSLSCVVCPVVWVWGCVLLLLLLSWLYSLWGMSQLLSLA